MKSGRALEILDVAEVPERLDASRRGAGTDRHQDPGLGPHLPDPCGVLGRGDGPFDERQVVRSIDDRRGSLPEVGDLDRVRYGEELVLAVEHRELTAVAGGEFPDRQPGALALAHR
jgi:hypothetical protein